MTEPYYQTDNKLRKLIHSTAGDPLIENWHSYRILAMASMPVHGGRSLSPVENGEGKKNQHVHFHYTFYKVFTDAAHFFFYKFKISVHSNDFVRGDW